MPCFYYHLLCVSSKYTSKVIATGTKINPEIIFLASSVPCLKNYTMVVALHQVLNYKLL